MSAKSAVLVIVCGAFIALLGARASDARAWQTALRASDAKVRLLGLKSHAAHPKRHILPLLRHVGASKPQTERRSKPATSPPATLPAPAAPSVVQPNDPDWSEQWGLRQINAPAAWALMTGPLRPVVVAVVDSGVDPSQPDLQGALVPGADFADASGSTADQYGHGTMVAGVIAARGDNGSGVAGVCWTCSIMPVKVLDASGMGTSANVALGIRWAADHGANVINLSFVLSAPDADVAAAIAHAHDDGAIVVAAAGNGGTDAPTYPASYPFVVSVAATDNADELYPWSSRGSWVTLAAPGCSMTTTLGGGSANFCGTSAAAPIVAGLAAIGYQTGAVSEAQLEAELERTASPLPGAVGSGRVNAMQLVQRFATAA